MNNCDLHVITCIFNPKGYKSRTKLYHEWLIAMKKADVSIHVIECTYPGLEFTTPDDPSIHQIRVKSNSVLWAKENLLNIAVAKLPKNAEYLLITDADIFYQNEDFPTVIIESLEKNSVVQAWSHCHDLGPDNWPLRTSEWGSDTHTSFGYYYANNLFYLVGSRPTCAHPGYCWAYRRTVLEKTEGLFEYGILGGADTNMAMAWANKLNLIKNKESDKFTIALRDWSEKAKTATNGEIGYADLFINHGFHGYKSKRFYVERKEILVNHDYDPKLDLKRNELGVLEFVGNKPKFEVDVAEYFASREEDEAFVA
jgi:hypothetical protein